jgi:porin
MSLHPKNAGRCLAVVLASCVSIPAIAQDYPRPEPDQTTQPATTSALPDNGAKPAPDRFKRFDDLSLKGWAIAYPKVADTILADHLGVRDALADVGIGISPINTANFQYDFLQNDRGYRGPQLYNGQRLTRTNTTIGITVTYDLNQLGLKGGQIVTSANIVNNSFPKVNGPNNIRIGRLHYYQDLIDGVLDFKIGYIDNRQEFLGINVGGNLATGNLGPQATIPFQLGLSYGGFATPGFNIRVRSKSGFYNKFGVQRSLPPGGAAAEKSVNPGGFRFAPPDTGVVLIDEIGYNRPSAAGTRSTWVRFGGIHNSTRYTRFADGREQDNWAAFIAVDRQLTQIDSTKPFRGVYAGATFNYAPPAQNFYTQYYEGRVYGVGLIGSRPFDLASFVTTYNVYSPVGLRARVPDGSYHSGTWAATASYAYRAAAGIYIQPGLGITVHPIFSPKFAPALNGYLSLITIF